METKGQPPPEPPKAAETEYGPNTSMRLFGKWLSREIKNDMSNISKGIFSLSGPQKENMEQANQRLGIFLNNLSRSKRIDFVNLTHGWDLEFSKEKTNEEIKPGEHDIDPDLTRKFINALFHNVNTSLHIFSGSEIIEATGGPLQKRAASNITTSSLGIVELLEPFKKAYKIKIHVDESHEIDVEIEKDFDFSKDMSPLENYFYGSSFKTEDGRYFNSTLLKDPEVANNLEFLLKPLGLTDGLTTIEEINKKRKEIPKIKGTTTFLKFHEKDELKLKYGFCYYPKEVGSNGLLPLEFEFRMIKEARQDAEKEPILVLEGEDLEAFKSLISTHPNLILSKNEQNGLLTVTYKPPPISTTS